MWRPDNWISEISFEEITKIKPCLVSMMTIKEKELALPFLWATYF